MCTGKHQFNDHKYGIRECNKKKRKFCIHIVAWCANCNSNCQTNVSQYLSKQKAEIQACKKRPVKDITFSAIESSAN